MSSLPEGLRYSSTHEWVRDEEDGTVRVGITDHAQGLLGDLVFVELPDPGRALAAGAECGVVESVKAASDLYAPLAGEVVEVNEALSSTPELINQDPYGKGWILRLRVADATGLDSLLDAAQYQTMVDAEQG